MKKLLFLTAAVQGLFAGAMLLIATALVPQWKGKEPEAYRTSFKAVGPYLGNLMIPLMVASILLPLIGLIADKTKRRLCTVSFLLVFALFPLYRLVHGPVNDLLLGNSVLLPDELSKLRDKWFYWHWVRTILGGSAFLTSLLALKRP